MIVQFKLAFVKVIWFIYNMNHTYLSSSQLRILIAIAETGSFTLAAERLGLTQPGVSHSVQELEKTLGVRLFERRRGEGAVATGAGQRALVEARAALVHLERLEQHARDEANLVSGRLRLTCFPSASRSRIPAVLAEYHRRYPSVQLEVFEGGGETTERDIRARAVDLGMVALPTAPDFATFTAYQDELMVVVHQGSPIQGSKGRISARALLQTPFLMPDDATEALVRSVFATAGGQPRTALLVENAALRLEVVRQGLGVTMMPANNLPPADQRQGLRVLGLRPNVTRHVAFAAVSLESLSPAANAFVDLLEQSSPSITTAL
jgi:DNA-binding transcriptional LysR family regulator